MKSSFLVPDIPTNNERLAQMIRIYRSPLPRRPGMPSGILHPRTTGRVLPPPITTPAPLPVPPPIPQPTVPVVVRPSRRMSPIVRSKSPPKVIRRAESPPKRPIINEAINIERLKLARDEAERAMKDHKIFTIYGPYPALREALRRLFCSSLNLLIRQIPFCLF